MLLGVFLLIVGFRGGLVADKGSSVPIEDEWDGEGLSMIKPLAKGTFHFLNLFQAHNEHRIFLTRVTSLCLYLANGQWDPRLNMYLSIVLVACNAILTCRLLASHISPRLCPLVYIVIGLCFSAPLAPENLLWGFQSSFHFLNFLTLSSIYFLIREKNTGWTLAMGAICLMLLLVNLGSGILVAPIIAGLVLVPLCKRYRAAGLTPVDKWQAASIAGFCLVIFVVGILIRAQGDEAAHASNLQMGFKTFSECLAFPFTTPLAALVIYTPFLLLFIGLIVRPRLLNTGTSRILGFGLWVIIQSAAIAYARGAASPSVRYYDILQLGGIANFVAALWILQNMTLHKVAQWIGAMLFCSWLIFISLGFFKQIQLSFDDLIPRWQRKTRGYEMTMKQYMDGQIDRQGLIRKQAAKRPYPHLDRFLTLMIDDPDIQRDLPWNVRASTKFPPPLPGEAFVENGYYSTTPPPSGGTSVGSHGLRGNKTKGTFLSAPISTPYSYITLKVAGYPTAEKMQISLLSEKGNRSIHLTEDPRESWKTVLVEVPSSPFRLRLIDRNREKWEAITEIRGIGQLSAWTFHAGNVARKLLLLGIILLVSSVLLLVLHPDADRAEGARRQV